MNGRAPIPMADGTSTPLSGGVSCEVSLVREASGREMVVKQPLPRLKVAADWRSNPERYEVEVRALRALRELLGEKAVPAVLWVEEVHQRFAMERIESRFRNWKAELLSGRVELTTAAKAGELLGLLHSRSATRSDLRTAFDNRTYFEELRIEPFFERVAKRNPSLAEGIACAIANLRAPGTALVHGDFSPKNILADAAEVVILDLEIAHWGNPRFDVAFCLSHLLLKALRERVDPAPYVAASLRFLAAYRQCGLPVLDAQLTRMLGCLLLARLDGASPVDYLAQLDTVRVRALASELIDHPTADVQFAVEKGLVHSR
jgi:5-methylthioribose kinase